MALEFYYGSGSPFAWRVWLALEFKGVAYTLRTISFSEKEHRSPAFLAINPRGKVPAIVDDGFALYESVAIVEYVEERFPDGPSLFPGDVRDRARIRRIVQEADLYFGDAMGPLLDQVLFSPREKWDEQRIAEARKRFAREVAVWESVAGDTFLAGPEVTAADFALYPHLALALRMDRRKPDLEVQSLVGPKLAAWAARVAALPIVGKTVPPHWK